MENRFMIVLSLITCSLGLFIRIWATGYISQDVMHSRQVNTSKFVTTGPYSITRNPLYLGTGLIGIAMGFILNFSSLIFLAIVIPIRAYRLITFEQCEFAAEQQYSEAYMNYCQTVPIIVPSAAGLSKVPQLLKEKTDWVDGLSGNWKTGWQMVLYFALLIYPGLNTFCLVFAGYLIVIAAIFASRKFGKQQRPIFSPRGAESSQKQK